MTGNIEARVLFSLCLTTLHCAVNLLRSKSSDLQHGVVVPQGTVQQVLKRMEDVQAMCEKRKESLQKLCGPRKRPVQSVSPAPIARSPSPVPYPHDKVDSAMELNRKTSSAEGSVKKSPVFLQKSARVSGLCCCFFIVYSVVQLTVSVLHVFVRL